MDTTLFPKIQNQVCDVLALLSRMESPVKANLHAGFGPADEGLSTAKKLAASASSDWNVIGFEFESDARLIMGILPKRFARFGLDIHPDKTRLIRFGKPENDPPHRSDNGTFDFLGFTHYWRKSRRGNWVIKRKTARKRLRRTSKALWLWIKDNRHLPIEQLHRKLTQKLQGHYQYFGIRGNYRQLALIYQAARAAWHYWLNRRSRLQNLIWDDFTKLFQRFPLPKPRIVHAI